MELTEAERLLLHNQYEILRKLDTAQEDHYEVLLTCLYQGYLEDLEDLLPHFEKPINPEVRSEVRQILQMFRALTPPHGEVRPAVVFVGFDGNEEGEHYSYARFLLEDRGLWRESKSDNYNTHYPVLDAYRKMLAVWEALPNQFALTPEDIAEIVTHAPFGSVNDNR